MHKVIDIHCHSAILPNSYRVTKPDLDLIDENSPASLWFIHRKGFIKTTLSKWVDASCWSQSDFTTLQEGNYQALFISLYPVEQGFAKSKGGFLSFIRDFLKPLAGSSFTPFRFSYLNNIVANSRYNYFESLQQEYRSYFNTATNQFNVIQPDEDLNDQSLNVIITIEGAHSFISGHDVMNQAELDTAVANVISSKKWKHPPFFVTFAHHFFNGFCTHAKSLFAKAIAGIANQKYGMRNYDWQPEDTVPAISPIGYEVIHAMLSTANGKRILIDVKHMSVEARTAYYNYVKRTFPTEIIPIVFSHGGYELFYKHEISINNSDLDEIYRSGGLIGIEFDLRVLGVKENNEHFQRLMNKYIGCNVEVEIKALWFNIITMAEYAFSRGYNDPWKCLAIGSDYDGLIDALGKNKIASDMPVILDGLKACIGFYSRDSAAQIQNINTDEVFQRICVTNAANFLKNHYN